MEEEDKEKVSMWQVFYDDLSLLFFFGIVIPTVFYLIWGVMEYANAPITSISVQQVVVP
ncbi:MAG: hypothetical protein AABZ11_01265 [Nitrospinota bacterium]